MPVTPEEIQERAFAFSGRWKEAVKENAQAQSFWISFFNVFGVELDLVADFEHPVKFPGGGPPKRIDLLWPGLLLVEHKSAGRSLDVAYDQALRYVSMLPAKDRPKYVRVSNFARFRLYYLEDLKKKSVEFDRLSLHDNVGLFGFMLGGESQRAEQEAKVNIKAAELMGDLHDALKASGYTGQALEVFLVRVMFCLFADSTGIFDERGQFTQYVSERTSPDGSDVGSRLSRLFQVLDTRKEDRGEKLAPALDGLPYVDGGLFKDRFDSPDFDGEMRDLLLKCCHFDWSPVSPAIFGTLFQSVMDSQKRRDLGGHYTSEENILKVVGPLFLDDLRAEMEGCRTNKRALNDLLLKISKLRFLDPACGCGNFLAVAYRELRLLDTEIRARLRGRSPDPAQRVLSVESMREQMKGAIDVDAFYGIEIEEFPAKIAEVAMWLVDHQMNVQLSDALGSRYVRLPLVKSARIVRGNSLRLDWNEVLPRGQASYILGNPPFAGTHMLSPEQRGDMDDVFGGVANHGLLDYVSAWYLKAAQYIQGTDVAVAFVSTKSITQGEQVGVLWNTLLAKYHLKIRFAHTTFKWTNEARGKAAVHCIIIGFGLSEPRNPAIFDYETPEARPHRVEVRRDQPVPCGCAGHPSVWPLETDMRNAGGGCGEPTH